MKRILVTGSNGFIGGYILRSLNDLGYFVCGCGRGSNRNPDIPYFEADLSKVIQPDVNFDVVIHTAARSPEASFTEYFTDNVLVTRNIIDFAKNNGVRKFIYLSAVSSFGKVDTMLSEDSPRNNPDDYGLTKYIAEKLIRNSGLDNDVYILPGVVGKRCRNPYIIRLAEALYQDRDVHCYNSEGMFNNVLLISDLCDFMLKRIKSEEAGDVFLLGCAERKRVRDMVSILADRLKSTSKIEFVPNPRWGFVLNIQKALNAGFVSSSFEETVNVVCDEVRRRLK